MVSLGLGKHAILIQKPIQFAQALLVVQCLYTLANTTIKFSILLLYRRLFPGKRFKNVLWAITGLLVLFALARILSVIIQCTPVAAVWNPMHYPNAHCVNHKIVLLVGAVVTAIFDVIILSLPMPILWHLHASKTRRKQLIGIFGLGGL